MIQTKHIVTTAHGPTMWKPPARTLQKRTLPPEREIPKIKLPKRETEEDQKKTFAGKQRQTRESVIILSHLSHKDQKIWALKRIYETTYIHQDAAEFSAQPERLKKLIKLPMVLMRR